MIIEKHFQPSCSEYSVVLNYLTKDQTERIKGLENDIAGLRKWLNDYKKKHGIKEQKEFFQYKDPKEWYEANKKYYADSKVKQMNKEYSKKYNEMRKKYKIKDQDIFDTSIHEFNWMSDSSVEINGLIKKHDK